VSIRIRLDEFDRLTSALGWTNDASRARNIGISPSTLTRLRAGEQHASAQLIHLVLTALQAPYASLFEGDNARAEVA